MKRKILLFTVMSVCITGAFAQKKQKDQVTGFAITGDQKGKTGWREVRLVNMETGEELKNIYSSKSEIEVLNARTGKPVLKKDKTVNEAEAKRDVVVVKKVVNLDEELDKANGNRQVIRQVYVRTAPTVSKDHPFATNSAALAYDKKHERLYYTPMGINQLRYIDMKGKTPKVYFFEDEAFGKVTGSHDSPNQITRMVIASDGNGYALTNDAKSLIRFTTGKKPEISNLGSLSDDPANKISVHRAGFGGDIVADANENIYLVTASKNVFRIALGSRVATYLGSIKGLPAGFSTNGAMVEEGSKVIVASSESTLGYFRFDLADLSKPAERASSEGQVFNASDLANGNLAFTKKKKDRKEVKEEPEVIAEVTPVKDEETTTQRPGIESEAMVNRNIVVYPNPANAGGTVRLSFTDQPVGRYQVQLLDLSGKLITNREVNINNKVQIEELKLPELLAKGNYLVKVTSEPNKVSVVNKLVVQ